MGGWVVRERSVVIGPEWAGLQHLYFDCVEDRGVAREEDEEGDEEGGEEGDEGQVMCQGGHCQESSSAILRFARSGKCAFYRGDVSAQIMWNSRGGIPFHAYNRL